MSENILKKEFAQRDVKRIRDLVTKKYGEATGIQTGYSKQHVDHVEGDVWEENGKNWTIKDGIKQNITKLDVFREMSAIPLLCPSCNNFMKTIYDKKMYSIHKMCMNCVSTFETQLKTQGKYEEYAKNLISGNIKHFLKEYEEFLNDPAILNNNSFVSEDGVIDKWAGNNKEAVAKQKETLDNIRKDII